MADAALIEHLRSKIGAIESSGSQARAYPAQPDSEVFGAAQDSGIAVEHEANGKPGKQSRAKSAFSKIVDLVNVSDRSERGIRERLLREGFPEEEVEEAIDRAIDYGFIDDKRFAEVLIRSRLSQGKGSAGIIRELDSHDINVNDVPGWPYEFPISHEEEIERALDLLGRKPPRSKNVRDGAYRKLVGKGYPPSVAASAARLWVDSRAE